MVLAKFIFKVCVFLLSYFLSESVDLFLFLTLSALSLLIFPLFHLNHQFSVLLLLDGEALSSLDRFSVPDPDGHLSVLGVHLRQFVRQF